MKENSQEKGLNIYRVCNVLLPNWRRPSERSKSEEDGRGEEEQSERRRKCPSARI